MRNPRSSSRSGSIEDDTATHLDCKPRASASRARRWEALPYGKFVLEVFAGAMVLSSVLLDDGFRVALPIDLQAGYDVCAPGVLRQLIGWIRSGRIWLLCLAPVCTTWSTTQTRGHRSTSASPAPTAVATVRLLRAARLEGIHVWIENPLHSRLWKWGPLSRELRLRGTTFHRLHYCTLGCAWKKATGISTSLPGSDIFDRQCPGHRAHVRLQGTVTVPGLGTRWRTSFASAYPRGLGILLRTVCRRAFPEGAHRASGEPRLHPGWAASLEAHRLPSHQGRRVEVTQCPAWPDLGWEGATSQWGGRVLQDERRILADIQRSCRLPS